MTLRGWKEIEAYTKLSVRAIKTLAKRAKNPFPVVYIARKPFMTETLFSKWIEAENESQKKACQ